MAQRSSRERVGSGHGSGSGRGGVSGVDALTEDWSLGGKDL